MAEAEEPREPAPRKKKKKRVGGEGAATKTASDAEKKPAPTPGAGTPAGEKLREALRAFEAGDYVLTRAKCDELASATDAEVRAAAMELRSRTTIDPAQIIVVLACALVLLVIVFVWVI